MLRRTLTVSLGVVVSALALAGTAAAAPPVHVVLGPLPVPHVPVSACVGSTCITTPPATSVTVDVGATLARPGVGLGLPLVLPMPCSGGRAGLSLRVTPGLASATLSGSISVKVNGGSVVSLPIDRTVGAGTPPLTISACAG
jgi:hypothetical protein